MLYYLQCILFVLMNRTIINSLIIILLRPFLFLILDILYFLVNISASAL